MTAFFTLPDWSTLADLADDQVPLLGSALLIAHDEYPDLDPEACNAQVEAHVTSLRRTRIGPFSEAEAIPLDDVTEESGLPWLTALERVLPELSVSQTVAKRLGFGQRIGGQDLDRIPA